MAVLLAVVALILSAFPAATLAAPSSSNSWIVTLRANVDAGSRAHDLARQHGGSVGFLYRHALNGFSFRGSPAAAAALSRNPMVALVEADAEVWLETTQTDATWGLDRIDQRDRTLDDMYSYETTGEGVTAYVIDSGIRTSHSEFGGRAVVGADFVGDGRNGQDCNGHGTHVAGTIGGATFGVAKEVKLVSVRVFGCTGGSAWSTIIAGIDWVRGDHGAGPAVANMSLGGSANWSVDSATNNLVNDGVAVVVAAGNNTTDACSRSPARVAAAMTISATSTSDAKASWANYGSCVDWFAPGVSITSAGITGDSATATKSGTSMAAPHTAGVAALYLEANSDATPGAARTALYEATTKGIVTSSSTVNNHLLYSQVTPPSGSTNRAPTAADVTATGDENTTIAWAPSVSDPDTGSTLTCSIASQSPSGGTASVAPDCTSGSYVPAADFSGVATFTYAVSDGSLDDTGTVAVTVNDVAEPPPSNETITLAVTPYKVKGVQHADLSWSGTAAGTSVDVLRDGVKIATVTGSGHTDRIGNKGGGTYTYTVCETGTSTCSNEVSVSY